MSSFELVDKLMATAAMHESRPPVSHVLSVMGGGDINKAYIAQVNSQTYFEGKIAEEMVGNEAYQVREPCLFAKKPFPIASITKVFTAALYFNAIQRGQIALDVKLSQFTSDNYIEKLAKLYSAERSEFADFIHVLSQAGSSATVADLLSHKSGLAGYQDNGKDNFLNFEAHKSFPAYKYLSSNPKVQNGIYGRFSYSNAGYGLLHLIIEALTETPYKQLVETEIIKPLSLKRTFFHDESQPMGFGCGLYSTTGDLTSFIKQIASSDKFAPMFSTQEKKWDYNLGLISKEINGRIWYGHTGGARYVTSAVFVNKETGDAFSYAVYGDVMQREKERVQQNSR